MRDTALLYPVFAQVALTYVLLFWMARERFKAVSEGKVMRGDPGVRPTWTGRAGAVSNCFHNQLETPLLFYAVIAFTMFANAGDRVTLMLAWAYVVARIIHAAIHTTYNRIMHRFSVFVISTLILLALWVRLALHVSMGPAAV